jgi:hypothetical protein
VIRDHVQESINWWAEMNRFETETRPVQLTDMQIRVLTMILAEWRRDVNDNTALADLAAALEVDGPESS